MREVSCRALDMFFRAAKKRRISTGLLAEGTGYELAHLRDPHERVEWSSFVRFMRNAGAIWSQEELLAMSAGFLRSPVVRSIFTPARLLFGPNELYRWATGDRRGGGKQLFLCIQNSYASLDGRHSRLELTLPPGYEPCPEFFLISKGVFSELPTLIGLDKASVTMTEIPSGVRYDITIPEERGVLPRIRRTLAWPFAMRTAAKELKDAHEKLVARHEELEKAKDTLDELNKSLEEKVDARTAELKATIERLEEAKAVRDRIFANVNHEIRTPLTLIFLAVHELRGTLPTASTPPVARALENIEAGARRQLRLVDEMLLLAESREGEIRLDLTTCDMRAVVARSVQAWEASARAAGLQLHVDATETCFVAGDTNALDRVLGNLLSNAMKFTPVGGAVRVRLSAEGERAVLDVQDTGVGIDPELLPRLFGRFERSRAAVSRKVSGSGLGLSIVKGLVEAQHGTIEVLAPPGGGVRFRVTIPALAGPGATTLEPAVALRPQDFGAAFPVPDEREVYEPPHPPKATLLLAEDDAPLRHRIASLLAHHYRVYVAKDGASALRLAELQRPDLLITDVAMPGIDGIELTRRFRALGGNRAAPVLLLTAYGEIRDRLVGFEAGAVDYVVKPFEPAELLARVRSQLALRAVALRLVESEKLAALGVLSTGLAHELRNPANGIVNAIGPLRELLPPELLADGPIAQLLEVVAECSVRVAAISKHLLGFRQGADLERRPVLVEALLDRVRATSQPALTGVELRQALDYRGSVSCAEPLMTQVFANLLDNAAYAAGRGGWVEVRTGLENGRVVVEFADSGPGVPVQLRERIFEPFFTTKPAGEGTGLGLATAREIVTRHGGTLDVRQSAAGAAVFRIEMPLNGGGPGPLTRASRAPSRA